jgi:hypothetical protein
MNKLKLSIIKTFQGMAQDTSGLLLCCTNNDNGEPVVHRVIATDSVVSLLCELKRAGNRRTRRVCYDQGVGALHRFHWNEKSNKWTIKKIEGYNEDKVFVKVIPYSFTSATDITMKSLRSAIIDHNLFSIEDAERAIEQDRIRDEEQRQNDLISTKQEELKTLLQNLDEDEIETLKEFVTKDEDLCKQIVDEMLSKLKI